MILKLCARCNGLYYFLFGRGNSSGCEYGTHTVRVLQVNSRTVRVFKEAKRYEYEYTNNNDTRSATVHSLQSARGKTAYTVRMIHSFNTISARKDSSLYEHGYSTVLQVKRRTHI